jgi:hypothetical protein
MVKDFRKIKYRPVKANSIDTKSIGAIDSTKPKASKIKISEPKNISPTTGKKRDEEEFK